MRVYVINTIDRETQEKKVSQEAYSSFEKAIEFITTRAEKVTAVSPWTYSTDTTIYQITDLRVV